MHPLRWRKLTGVLRLWNLLFLIGIIAGVNVDRDTTAEHEHSVVRIRGVWEEAGGLFEINREVCIECAEILAEELVGLPERRKAVRPAR